jgi:hypothetical protein
MNWLARLKKIESAPAPTLQKLQKGVSVVSVGAYPEPFQKSQLGNDTFTARLALFTERGLSLDDAQVQADKLARRDLEHDDRRLCLECQHLSGNVEARRCSQWRKQGIGSPAIPADLATMLKRCADFDDRLEMAA